MMSVKCEEDEKWLVNLSRQVIKLKKQQKIYHDTQKGEPFDKVVIVRYHFLILMFLIIIPNACIQKNVMISNANHVLHSQKMKRDELLKINHY